MASASHPVRLVFGAAEVNKFGPDEWVQVKALLKEHRVFEIDSAHGYVRSPTTSRPSDNARVERKRGTTKQLQ